MGNIRAEFGSESLDKIFCYFMRTIVRMEKGGLLALPAKNDLTAEPQRSYLDLAMRMVTDAQPEEVARPILESQYNFILSNSQQTPETAMEMWFIRELSLHFHYDQDPSGFLLSTCNLWGDLAGAYSCRSFYPNMGKEWQVAHHVDDVMASIPESFYQLHDF